MAQTAVADAVSDRLAVHWTRCPVIDNNSTGSTPADASVFLTVQYPFSTSERITFGAPGANVHREEGAFRLVLQVERGAGEAQGRLWSDELASLFRDKHFDGVQTFSPSSASSDDANENGNFYTLAIAVPYRFDFLG